MANKNIANGTTDPGVSVVMKDYVDHFVVGLAFASSIATLNIEMGEVFTCEVDLLGQPLFEFSLNDG